MKYFSMFSGIGGFEHGINSNGCCIGFSEVDKYAIQIYEKHFKGHKNYGDCTRIDWKAVPDFDILVGGFPCQAFSIAGKRGGFKDTRGTLFFEIAKCLKEKQPRLCLLENVKGLLSHDKGATFATILSTLDELGYSVEWQVLNSKNFGVPQNRERVFIVGHLGEGSGRKVFPITESGGRDSQSHQETQGEGQRVRGEDIPYLAGSLRVGGGDTKDLIAQTLAQRDYKGGNNLILAPNGKEIDLSNAPVDKPFQLLETRTELGKKTRREIRKNEGRDSTMRGKDDKKYIPKDDNIANCLTTGKENIEKWLFENQKIRRLTPTECERLQGFPDGWTEGISDSQRYKCLGNAVTTNVVQAIINKMLEESLF